MKRPRPITPHVSANPLVCGEFSQGAAYTNWRPQGAGDWLLIYTIAGAGRIVADGGVHQLGEHQALLYRPEAAQDYSTEATAGHWTLRWAHFMPKAHWRPWLVWPEIGRGAGRVRLRAESAERFASALGRMLLASRIGGVASTELALNALEEALIWAHREIAGDRWLSLDPRIRRAVDRLAAEPARPLSLAELARYCGLSESRFSHLFKEQLHQTPRQFGETLRLELARELLGHTSLAVREVADQAGFADPLYFSRRFARAFGHPPAETRERSR